MPLIMCHSPKGGVGTSFVAAGLAQGLALLGRDVVALDMTAQDGLKLYFGIAPGRALPEFGEGGGEPALVGAVSLRSAWRAAHAPQFARDLRAGNLPFDSETIFIADVASTDEQLARLLRHHALMHVCALVPSAMTLAQLPRIGSGRALDTLVDTAFVLNQLDETRRFARHAVRFLRELLGENLVAQIFHDEAVNEAVGMQQTLSRYAPASAALAGLRALIAVVDQRCADFAGKAGETDLVPRPVSKSAAA